MSELLTLSARMREELAGGPIAAEAEALLEGIALAARILASEILRAPLAGLTGLAGRRNIQGEDVAQLDEFAHETMSRCLSATGVVAALVSEESGEPIFVDGSAIEPAFSWSSAAGELAARVCPRPREGRLRWSARGDGCGC